MAVRAASCPRPLVQNPPAALQAARSRFVAAPVRPASSERRKTAAPQSITINNSDMTPGCQF
jgi:hypothetical protein